MQVTTNPMAAASLTTPQPLDTGNTTNGSSDGSDTSTATVTANDFLKLLVTEMQNQDPTANTDPNEYINQLVQVNSLEQLIAINQDLSWVSSAEGGSGSGGTSGHVASSPASGVSAAVPTAVSGNLSATDTGGSASRVAQAMESAAQTLAPGSSGTPMGSSIASLRSRADAARTQISNPAH